LTTAVGTFCYNASSDILLSLIKHSAIGAHKVFVLQAKAFLNSEPHGGGPLAKRTESL